MSCFDEFISKLPDISGAKACGVYPLSVNAADGVTAFMVRGADADELIVCGEGADAFSGERSESGAYLTAPLTHENACALRKLFPFTAPVPVLSRDRTAGVGDRLGIACPGHIRVFNDYDAYPVFAQQSIRELNLTQRTYEDVLDCVSFAVFRDGFKRGFGADGDHLKKAEEVEYALGLGYTMITLDCSEHIRGDVDGLSADDCAAQCKPSEELKALYLGQSITVEDTVITYDEDSLRRCQMIYGAAIEFAAGIYGKYFADGRCAADFEISIDETATPTAPAQHYFVASELTRRGVKFQTMAPRFCGEFQKGVDYIGDLAQFELELKAHAAIARHFGYKLSIHSGSDKFSTFELIGKYTRGRFHLKTAGTNWLEAMRAVAAADPGLYREVHKYALSMFGEAKKFYHVTTDLSKIPDVDGLADEQLVALFDQNDARQLIHITYGFILTVKDCGGGYIFRDRLYKIWRDNEQTYSDMLYRHIGHHLELLYKGFN